MHPLPKFALAVGAALLAAPQTYAHDFFLMPEAFVADASTTKIAATVGSAFPTPEIVVAADRVASVTAQSAGGAPTVSISGTKEKALELSLNSRSDGPSIVGVALAPRDVEYGEDRIDLILGEYQVSEAAKSAAAALPRPRTLKVDSRRFAKTLVCRKTCTGIESVQPHGFELEFVPVAADRFQLRESGKPLGGYPITIATRDGKRHEMITDPRGEVIVPSDTKGATMLFASTMAVPSTPGARFILRLTSLTTAR